MDASSGGDCEPELRGRLFLLYLFVFIPDSLHYKVVDLPKLGNFLSPTLDG